MRAVACPFCGEADVIWVPESEPDVVRIGDRLEDPQEHVQPRSVPLARGGVSWRYVAGDNCILHLRARIEALEARG